jgi:threonine dehydrogenase-like Zn-dependent dehydrogenase
MSVGLGDLPARASAVRLDAPGQHGLTDVHVQAPARDEVIVAVGAVGVCGSDLELFSGHRPPEVTSYPVVPGHEWAGTVAAVGEDVDHIEPRRPVVAEGFRFCGVCSRCRQGETTLCLRGYAETGFTHSGAFADFVGVPAHLVHELPEGADLQLAALLEPAACAAEAFLRAQSQPGCSVAVVGAGTLGLLSLELSLLDHPRRLIAVDLRSDRLQVARELGATDAITAAGIDSLAGTCDVVVEAAGNPEAVKTALELARPGATVCLLGISGSDTPQLASDTLTLSQLHLHGIFGAPSRAWEYVVSLFAQGLLDPEPLVSHRLPLSRYEEALELLSAAPEGVGKVLLIPAKEG